MPWTFERVSGAKQGACGGLAWDGKAILFSAVDESRVLRFDPSTGETSEFRRYTYRVNGLGFGPGGELYACQEGGRRVIQFMPDGSATFTEVRLAGKMHNYPTDLMVDRKGRIWFADPHHKIPTIGPQMYPLLDHESVLRLERDNRRDWKMKRVTFDTFCPRAVMLSPDETVLYVAVGDGIVTEQCSLRAYPIRGDGSVGLYETLFAFGADHRGMHRGAEGLCLDDEGNLVACAGSTKSGPGALIYVISPSGAVLETHELPFDMPIRCAFGGAGLESLYVTSGDGGLYRANAGNRHGYQRF